MIIDELIERAFCEGYEFAQKEFIGALDIKSHMNFTGMNAKAAYKDLKKLSNNLKSKGIDSLNNNVAVRGDKSWYKAKSLKDGGRFATKWRRTN